MTVVIRDGLEFVDKNNPNIRFTVREWDYYGDGDILCAFTEHCIYPLSEIDLSEYYPIIDGKIINEENEYV